MRLDLGEPCLYDGIASLCGWDMYLNLNFERKVLSRNKFNERLYSDAQKHDGTL